MEGRKSAPREGASGTSRANQSHEGLRTPCRDQSYKEGWVREGPTFMLRKGSVRQGGRGL
eukprot:4479568-Pyramimonas_sp.AAC.1